MYGFWLDLLLFAAKAAVVVVALVFFVLAAGAVLRSVIAFAAKREKFKKDDGIVFRIENWGDKLAREKEILEKCMLNAVDDDTLEVFNRLRRKSAALRGSRGRADPKRLTAKGVLALRYFAKKAAAGKKAPAGKGAPAGAVPAKPAETAPAAAPAKPAETAGAAPEKPAETAGAAVAQPAGTAGAAPAKPSRKGLTGPARIMSRDGFTLAVNPDLSVSVTGKLLFVVDFTGSPDCAEVKYLKRAVNLLAGDLSEGDEVVVRLSSPGGTVNGYGLAAAELGRLKKTGAKLTVAVDQVAASGGYLMACVADRLIAAPFAYIGSIGVVMELPNFNRLMKKYDVDYEQITAGEYKRTLTTFGENTEEGREKCREEVKQIHAIFKSHVAKYRPGADVEKLATGEVWLGSEAKELGLVDEIMTSDEYIAASADKYAAVLTVKYSERRKKGLIGLLTGKDAAGLAELAAALLRRAGFKTP